MKNQFDADLEFALKMADIADGITRHGFSNLTSLTITTKADDSPVSSVDLAVERALRDLVKTSEPTSDFLGEEHPSDQHSNRRWIIDPLDQTKNFLRGIEIFGTLIALEIDGEIVVGVVSAPRLGNRWWAVRGGGAFENGLRIRVSKISELAGTSGSIHAGAFVRSNARARGALIQLMENVAYVNSFGNFWAHMLVARGSLDWALSSGGDVWDYAAPSIIVSEAGGKFTDFSGDEYLYSGQALSSNGENHDGLLAILG